VEEDKTTGRDIIIICGKNNEPLLECSLPALNSELNALIKSMKH
jgi:hypothetical protein